MFGTPAPFVVGDTARALQWAPFTDESFVERPSCLRMFPKSEADERCTFPAWTKRRLKDLRSPGTKESFESDAGFAVPPESEPCSKSSWWGEGDNGNARWSGILSRSIMRRVHLCQYRSFSRHVLLGHAPPPPVRRPISRKSSFIFLRRGRSS